MLMILAAAVIAILSGVHLGTLASESSNLRRERKKEYDNVGFSRVVGVVAILVLVTKTAGIQKTTI